MIEITDKEFKQITEFIKRNYGINLKEEKRMLVTGRLQHVLQAAGCDSFAEYFDYVNADTSGEAVATMVEKITTNHTYFMREADHFQYFKDTILRHLKSTVQDKDLRLWCAACSTGEEAYTLAMLIDEVLGYEKSLWDAKILATDISRKVLSTAKSGIYCNEDIATLPKHWIKNYFQEIDRDYSVVKESIRKEVIFRAFNLMEETFPFKRKFHVIFCRNVMIYFDNETRTKLINKMYNNLEKGGYLFLGHSESVNRGDSKFQYVMPSVYRKGV
ncbi:MAG TPA: protein-glutamate O-methyltransferase CheR [Lachnospiraceae bacterium]|nr:protein-glutamate O-methyltransferase CheR [Lachnospiraceae bacterium]